MPGIKRQHSSSQSNQRPIKLKKQSTSTTVDKAIGTLKAGRSVPKFNPSLKPQKSVKSKIVTSKDKSPPPPLPRFPTLVPSQPATLTGFNFNFYKESPITELKRDSTVILSHESTSTEDLGLPSGTRATEIERSIKKLASGSYVGKIMNADAEDLVPSEASLAVYEYYDDNESSTLSPGSSHPRISGSSFVRQSAYDVAGFLASTESSKESGEVTSMPVLEEIAEEDRDSPPCLEDSNAPPVLETHLKYSESSDEELAASDDDVSMPKLHAESPTKLLSKSPRKMTGGQREIVFSFDTTGSMYNYMEEAKDRIQDMVRRLQAEMPGTRLAFVAHGDYYDLKNDRYLIKWIDFGASVGEVVNFFEDLPITHGGDADECYELVLQKVRESLSWSDGSQRSLVMIGDSDPHEPGYVFDDFVNDIDWRVETKKLNEMGVRIYGVQVGYRSNFYREISKMTGGAHLRLDTAEFTYDTLMSICLREGSIRHLKGYEHEVRTAAKKSGSNGGSLDLELERLFSSLKNIEDNKSLKQRARENKIKNIKIQELSAGVTQGSKKTPFTGMKPKAQKRPSENMPESSPSKKSKSIKTTKAIKSETKTKSPKSFEKTKKTLKLKTPIKKDMKKKPGRPPGSSSKKTLGRPPGSSSKKTLGRPPGSSSKKSPGKPSAKGDKTPAKPKKSPSKTEISKKPRGRPKKISVSTPSNKKSADTSKASTNKKSPGRPKLSSASSKAAPEKLKLSPAKNKKSPGKPKLSPATNKKSPGRPKLSPAINKKSPAKNKKSPGKPKLSPATNKKSPGRPKLSLAINKKSPANNKKSPGRPKLSPAINKKSPGRPKLSLAINKKSPANNKKSPGRPKLSPAINKKSPGRPKLSPAINKKSPGRPKLSPAINKKSPGRPKQSSGANKKSTISKKNIKKSPGKSKQTPISTARKKLDTKLSVKKQLEGPKKLSKDTKKSLGRPKQSTSDKSVKETKSSGKQKMKSSAKEVTKRSTVGPKTKSTKETVKKKPPTKQTTVSLAKALKSGKSKKPSVKRLQTSKSSKKVDTKGKKENMNDSATKKSVNVAAKKKVVSVKSGMKKSDKTKVSKTKAVKPGKSLKEKVGKKAIQNKEAKKKKTPTKVTTRKQIPKKEVKKKTAKKETKKDGKKTTAKNAVKSKPPADKKSVAKEGKMKKAAVSKKVMEKKKTVSSSSKQGKGSQLLMRENVNNSSFNTGPLSNMRWTPWEPLISSSQPKSKNWSQSLAWCSGYCNTDIYKGQNKIHALYEIAVLTPSSKRYPVLFFSTTGATFNIWDHFSTGVRKEIERVIRSKGTIVTRRGSAPGRSADSLLKSYNYIKSNFDYAWKTGSRNAEVIKDNFVVSKSKVK